jgi:PIN domain nuclease of toxin-antitoxin system
LRGVLLDTNVWSWTLLGNQHLTRAAQVANDDALNRYLSPISLYEVSQKVWLGKWPEMKAAEPRLREVAERQGLEWARLDAEICLMAGRLDWSHRDPFDRMLAATALAYDVPIISADRTFDGIVTRIW